jgi:hypothetical protein
MIGLMLNCRKSTENLVLNIAKFFIPSAELKFLLKLTKSGLSPNSFTTVWTVKKESCPPVTGTMQS